MNTPPHTPAASPLTVEWAGAAGMQRACWIAPAGVLPPKRIVEVDDQISADAAYRLVCEGTALLWRGDYHNARQLVQALARRQAPKRRAPAQTAVPADPIPPGAVVAPAVFHRHRQAQAQRARVLGMVLLPVAPGWRIAARRAPEVSAACEAVYGLLADEGVIALQSLLGLIGAYEWRRAGVAVPGLAGCIHPHYGVFSPVRGEYIGLVQAAPLPAGNLAFDVGTGTGVLAAVLAQRGVQRVLATDLDEQALACAHDNLVRLGVADRVELMQVDLFPPGRAPLVVCNPPWLPARPATAIEHALYDPDSAMLRGFLAGVGEHLTPGGEAWLILSDLAELLGLRAKDDLAGWIAAAGLEVVGQLQTRPRHAKANDANDPLFAARRREVTSLWRLRVRAALPSDSEPT